jgi:hypothetical protein
MRTMQDRGRRRTPVERALDNAVQKPYIEFHMQTFKRNQVEEALFKVAEPNSPKPSSELRTRIKRLLETDRSLPKDSESGEGMPFAFFSDESPGSGREIWFSAYEAFALGIGLLLMRHGWPQSFAVNVLRRVRGELEFAYVTTLAQDPKWLFDQEEIRRNAREGDFAFKNQDPFLLTIVSRRGEGGNNQGDPIAYGVKRGPSEALKFAHRFQTEGGGAWTMFDVVGIAHQVAAALAQTKPQSRGRR